MKSGEIKEQKMRLRLISENTANIEYLETEDNGMYHIEAMVNNEEIASALIYPDRSLAKGRIKPTETVWRLQSIGVHEMLENPSLTNSRGVGRELWRRIFARVGDDWLANSQLGFPDDQRAVTSLEKLAKPERGWIELHWIVGQKGANFIARLTPTGKAWVAGKISSGPAQEYDTFVSGALLQPDYLKWSGCHMPKVGTMDELFVQAEQKDPLFVPTRGILAGRGFKLPEDKIDDLLAIIGDPRESAGIFELDDWDRVEYFRTKIVPFLRQSLQFE